MASYHGASLVTGCFQVSFFNLFKLAIYTMRIIGNFFKVGKVGRHWNGSGIFAVNFEHIQQLILHIKPFQANVSFLFPLKT